MNARILALGAMLVVTASAVDAQSQKGKGGWGRGKATADSSTRPGSVDEKGRREKGSDDEGRRKDDKSFMNRAGGMLFSGISLTDAQETRVKAIRESYRPRMIALRDSARVTSKDGVRTAADSTFRAKAVALASAERRELRAVLTAEQQVKFDSNAKRMDDRMAKRFGKGKGRRGDRSDS